MDKVLAGQASNPQNPHKIKTSIIILALGGQIQGTHWLTWLARLDGNGELPGQCESISLCICCIVSSNVKRYLTSVLGLQRQTCMYSPAGIPVLTHHIFTWTCNF